MFTHVCCKLQLMCNIAFVTVALINARWRHTHISMGVIICALFDTFQQLLLATSVIKYLLGRHTFLAHLHSEHTKLPLLSGLQSLFFLQSDYEVVDCYLCRGSVASTVPKCLLYRLHSVHRRTVGTIQFHDYL